MAGFDEMCAAIKDGAAYRLQGSTLTVGGVTLELTDEQFDEAWDVMDEVDGDDWLVSLA